MGMFPLKYYQIIVLILLSLFFLQTIATLPFKSPVFDEPGHLARGYIYLKTSNMIIITHPPLIHIISAFPLLFMDIDIPLDYERYIINNDPITLGQEIFYRANENSNIVFFWSRLPFILLGIILGIYVYLWAKKLYGPKAGIFALLLYTFNPIIIGNTPLLLTDMSVTVFGFISLYYLWRFVSKKSFKNLIITGITFGLAQSSKFTALFLIPVFILLMFLSAYDFSPKILIKEFLAKRRIKEILFMSHSFIVILVLSLIVINIFYGFEGFLKPLDTRILEDKGTYFDKEAYKPTAIADRITDSTFLHGLITNIINYGSSVFPYSYLKDLAAVISMYSSETSTIGGGYLMGEYNKEGWWYYLILAFIIKTPIPLLIFILIAIYSSFFPAYKQVDENTYSHFSAERFKNALFILIPLIIFPLYFMFHNTVGGLRYLLPSFPFLFVFISRIFNVNIKRSIFIMLIILLSGWYVLESILIFPNYTAYFNQLIGGSPNGYKYLQGADLDSGQDLPLLKEYVNKNGISNLKLAYYGTPDPYYYLNFTCLACPVCPISIEAECPLRCEPNYGLIAVSASLLQNTPHLKNINCFDWIKAYKPLKQIGYTLFIYNIENPKNP